VLLLAVKVQVVFLGILLWKGRSNTITVHNLLLCLKLNLGGVGLYAKEFSCELSVPVVKRKS
jgi:hypothetical protein